MLKSTYKPSPGALQPLPDGWTEHKAPTGHTYYYNAATKESTYKRPVLPPAAPLPAAPIVRLSDPNVANAFMAQHAPRPEPQFGRGGFGGGRGGGNQQSRPRPQPRDKPKSRFDIPGCEPWVLVYTKYGRRFAFNPEKNASFWRIPDKLKAGILELDQARIRQKMEGKIQGDGEVAKGDKATKEGGAGLAPGPAPAPSLAPAPEAHDYDSSEYEEVEVTDDEGEEEDGTQAKRQRTEEPGGQDGPLEFTEEDIAAQLAAMGAEYGEQEEYGEYFDEEGVDNVYEAAPEISETDAVELFKDLLADHRISPYTSWETILEQGKIIDDSRYTVLSTTKARRDVFEQWSRTQITLLKERRAREEKQDPRIPYLAFLAAKATPKMYWPEFRRKYRSEEVMKDRNLADKDREKMYREHIKRLALSNSTAKADLKKLLAEQPLRLLNRSTNPDALPAAVRADVRYITLDAKSRDELVAAYVQDLETAPDEDGQRGEEEDEAAKKTREERRRRENALRDRERAVAEDKKREEQRMTWAKARLREEERELERAMQVGKKGLQSQLGIKKDSAVKQEEDADMEE
jgi:hypothetical protein